MKGCSPMAKDPAFLFYPSDFLIGTMLLTNEQIGKYVKLLCFQHQFGGKLTKQHVLDIIGTWDEKIMCKFTEEDGYYFNKRLLNEIDKRKKYCESRRQNANAPAYAKHMENENENKKQRIVKYYKEDFNSEKEKSNKFTPPTINQVISYCKERGNSVNAQQFIDFYTTKGWMVGKNKMKDWYAAVRTWEARDGRGPKQQKPIEKPPEYKNNPGDREKVAALIAQTVKNLKEKIGG
jgi:hypothetical protein